jgi:integrase
MNRPFDQMRARRAPDSEQDDGHVDTPEVRGVHPEKRQKAGIRPRHSRGCGVHRGEPCGCQVSWEASVWSGRERRKIRKSFPTRGAARSWQRDAAVAVARGQMQMPTRRTVNVAAGDWLERAYAGVIRNRSGDLYKPSVLRSYETSLRLHVLPELGHTRLSEVTRTDVQDLVDRMVAYGMNPSTVRNALLPLRAICRRALQRHELAVNPTTGLQLPSVRGRRDRVLTPKEARDLIGALRGSDVALWASAMYGGLRVGELRALGWQHVDLDRGLVRVERAFDPVAGFIAPKSRAGQRVVPIASEWRQYLIQHRRCCAWSDGLIFGRSRPDLPFDPSTVTARARRAWNAAGLKSVTLHECRHAFASLMIAAGVSAKALSTFMGHGSITITLDRYGHLLPGSETEAARLLDVYLSASDRKTE